MAENSLLEMGLSLLEAQENPHLYPEYRHVSSGKLNASKMILEEFGLSRSRACRLMDFVELRQKMLPQGNKFPQTEKQARVLAPYKNDPEKLDAIIERAKEVTGGTLELSAPALQEVVSNVVEELARVRD